MTTELAAGDELVALSTPTRSLRCQICRHPGEEFCSDRIRCNYRARIRLGIPKTVRDALLRKELGLPPKEAGQEVRGGEPPVARKRDYCKQHKTSFCLCVAGHIYRPPFGRRER